MEIKHFIIIFGLSLLGCAPQPQEDVQPDLFVTVLGIAQDAGAPQIGCQKACCRDLWGHPENYQKVISLGVVDRSADQVWILDATPDFKEQLNNLLSYIPEGNIASLQGIFLTHAHIGHYTGLMDLGREAMGAQNVPVYAMPRMVDFLQENGPWSQLVSLQNIELRALSQDSTIQLSKRLSITPFLVPHRDEYSETVGYKVSSREKSFIFIPDIDKWHKWEKNIVEEVKSVDYAFLDGAFFSEAELPNRDMSEIPHPFVPETMALFDDSKPELKEKVIFIHLNHTNPLLNDGPEYHDLLKKGYKIGRESQIFSLE